MKSIALNKSSKSTKLNPLKAAFTKILLTIALAGIFIFYIRYLYSATDMSPDSLIGYIYAVTGTLLLLMTIGLYVWRKRIKKHSRAKLHTFLSLHIGLGSLSLILLWMHAAGNYNPRSGTYALYALIITVVTGIIGRFFDRYCSSMAAKQMAVALTSTGEDRIDILERELQNIGVKTEEKKIHKKYGLWDISFSGAAVNSSPFISKHGISEASIADPGTKAQKLLKELNTVRAAHKKEYMYRFMIRAWRKFHVLATVVTLGLIAWHIEFAVTLLLHARGKH